MTTGLENLGGRSRFLMERGTTPRAETYSFHGYDGFFVDLHGDLAGAYFMSPNGVTVRAYKNWLHIEDDKMSRPIDGAGLMAPVLARIYHGELFFHDFELLASRHDDDGIYFAVTANGRRGNYGILGCAVPKEVTDASVEHLVALLQTWGRADKFGDFLGPEIVMSLRASFAARSVR